MNTSIALLRTGEIDNKNVSFSETLMPAGSATRDKPDSLSKAKKKHQVNETRYQRPEVDTYTMVLAGGKGTRLLPLTRERCKPVVPFGGSYKIIDFTLSNCINSGIGNIAILAQYQSRSLIQHLQSAWNINNPQLKQSIDVLSAEHNNGSTGYRGTADAIYQNLDVIESSKARYVMILAGDHIYKADYRKFLRFHLKSGADISVGCTSVPQEKAKHFGIMEVGSGNRITQFTEKPDPACTNADMNGNVFASMGIYIFSRQALLDVLTADATNEHSNHDFGQDIIPQALNDYKVFAYPFSGTQNTHYWRDVGTLDSYYRANMDLIDSPELLDIFSDSWKIWNAGRHFAPSSFYDTRTTLPTVLTESLIGEGCKLAACSVKRSLFHEGVEVGASSKIENSILLPNAIVGRNCEIRNAVIDQNTIIPDGTVVGVNPADDAKRFDITDGGIIVVSQSSDLRRPRRLHRRATSHPDNERALAVDVS